MRRARTGLDEDDGWRIERKFLLATAALPAWEAALRLHPACYHRPFPERLVNSVYLESRDLRHARAHRGGLARRHKLRLRWYGPLLGRVAAPVLEVKLRSGQLGSKLRFALPPLTVGPSFGAAALFRAIRRADLPHEIREDALASPLLIYARYRRRYYAAAGGRLRVTVDCDLQTGWGSLRGAPPRRLTPFEGAVIELKYTAGEAALGRGALQGLRLRVGRNSKFLLGMAPWFD